MSEHLCERCNKLVGRDILLALDKQRPKDRPPNLVHIKMFDQVYKTCKEAEQRAEKAEADAARYLKEMKEWKDAWIELNNKEGLK